VHIPPVKRVRTHRESCAYKSSPTQGCPAYRNSTVHHKNAFFNWFHVQDRWLFHVAAPVCRSSSRLSCGLFAKRGKRKEGGALRSRKCNKKGGIVQCLSPTFVNRSSLPIHIPNRWSLHFLKWWSFCTKAPVQCYILSQIKYDLPCWKSTTACYLENSSQYRLQCLLYQLPQPQRDKALGYQMRDRRFELSIQIFGIAPCLLQLWALMGTQEEISGKE
jgi:hypothetical protein